MILILLKTIALLLSESNRHMIDDKPQAATREDPKRFPTRERSVGLKHSSELN
jgi:hypothetical protein